ncbi:MAG: histidine kinase [Methylococcaceae bacterium]|nr:histidine kinase [Methylococcaceae bacterium]
MKHYTLAKLKYMVPSKELHPESHRLLPDCCTVNGVLAVVLIAEALALLLQLSDRGPAQRFWVDLGIRSLFVQWIVLISAAVLCRLSGVFYRRGPGWTGIVAFLIIQAVTLIVSAIVYQFLFATLSDWFERDPGWQFFLRNLGMSGIVSLILLRYSYVQLRWKRQERSEAEARLDALQSRIRPHFLFNSLNTIASLTRSNPALAEEIVQDLAELFRACLMPHQKLIDVCDELELVRQYLNIESQRLGKRLKIVWRTETVPGDARIPPLTLQPLVENAVKHGIEPSETGGEIRLEGRLEQDELVFCVENSLPADHVVQRRNGNRMALENVEARIQGCFPGRGQVITSVDHGVFRVRLVFPYTRSKR